MCCHLHFNLTIELLPKQKIHSNPFCTKIVDFACLTQKPLSERQLLQNAAKFLPIKMYILRRNFNFAFIFNCTPANWTSDSMTVPLKDLSIDEMVGA